MLPCSAILHDEITQTVDRIRGTGATPGPDFPLGYSSLEGNTSDYCCESSDVTDLIDLKSEFRRRPFGVHDQSPQ